MKNVYEIDGDIARVFIKDGSGNERISIIDKADVALVSRFKWHADEATGYARSGDGIMMSRWIMKPTGNLIVDHINHDRLDNRRINLRIVTKSINNRNKEKKGNVYWVPERGKWRVQCSVDRKSRYFGHYKDKDEAQKVADDIRRRIIAGEDVQGNSIRRFSGTPGVRWCKRDGVWEAQISLGRFKDKDDAIRAVESARSRV